MQYQSAQSPFLSLAFLFTFVAMTKVKAPPAQGVGVQCPSAQSPFLNLAFLCTYPAMTKVKVPPARCEVKSYRRPSIVIEGNFKMTNYKFFMYRIEVTNDHRAG
jgi:hypothetical protein